MPKRTKNFSRSRIVSQRQKLARKNETTEEREARLTLLRENYQRNWHNQTEEQLENYRETHRIRERSRRRREERRNLNRERMSNLRRSEKKVICARDVANVAMSESIWDYFVRLDDDDDGECKNARCRICNNIYSFKTTIYNLKSHLIKIHRDEIDVDTEVLRNLVNGYEKSIDGNVQKVRSTLRSAIWQYFEIVPALDSIAKCLICQNLFSFKSTSNNLRKHLRRFHDYVLEDSIHSLLEDNEETAETFELEEYTYSDIGSDTNADADAVWSLFEREGGGVARCAVCRAPLAAELQTLRDHLAQEHPKLVKSEDDTQSDKEEIEAIKQENEEDFSDVEYLDEAAEAREKQRVAELKKKKRIERKICSSDEPSPKKKKEEDEVTENFVKYVSSLLKEMPRELTMKLQMDVIDMIMVAKLKYEASLKDEQSSKNNINVEHIVDKNQLTTGNPKNIVLSIPNKVGSRSEVKNIEVYGGTGFHDSAMMTITSAAVTRTYQNRNAMQPKETNMQSTSDTSSNQKTTKNVILLQNNFIKDYKIQKDKNSCDEQNRDEFSGN